MKSIGSRLNHYLEERLEVPSLWRQLTDRKIPRGVGWIHTLGSATLFLLIVQIVTGIALAFYYVPSPEHAYESVDLITHQLPFGWLVRGIHKWAASLVVICALLHLLRVLFMGAFKYPRELTWVVGVALLLVILAFGFTGYLLPWDQKAYWATVVGTHIAGYTPLIGDSVMEILRGQTEVGVRTLGRFYAVHTLFLPVLLFGLVFIHLAMVIKQGIAPPPLGGFASVSRHHYARRYEKFKEAGHPFFKSMARDSFVAAVLLLLLVILTWQLGVPLEAEADPTSTTYVPRPEWYFFFLFELLWWFPGDWISVATFWIPVGLIVILLLLPWIDRSIHRAPLRRPWVTGLTTVVLACAIFLTYKGATAPLPASEAVETSTELEGKTFSPLAQRGRQVYEEQACAACHTLEGAGGTAGPSLDGIGADRETEWLKQFITNPAQIQPGAEMPPYDSLSSDDLEALLAYLETLE